MRRMLTVLSLLLALSAGLLAAPPPMAHAHAEAPVAVSTVVAGPYTVELARYADTPVAGADLPLVVTPLPGSTPLSGVGLTARPGLGTNATPTHAVLVADLDAPGSFAGSARFTVAGAWLLDLDLDGPAGPARATLAVTAAAPGAIPVWLGWLMGLSPLAGLVWFGWWQHRYLRQLEGGAAALAS